MKFYSSLAAMMHHPPAYGDPFVIQWEIPTPKDDRERMYIVFDGVSEYLRCLDKGRYDTSHEVFIAPSYGSEDIQGHPAFDIDMPLTARDQLPSTWQEDLQADIVKVLSDQYPGIDIDLPDNQWVWMTSHNPRKISKHLTIKGITFMCWREQMRLLVDTIKTIPGRISTQCVIDAIDEGILRKHGSLRMPLNSKRPTIDSDGTIHRYPMAIDSEEHTFLDGLVMIHDENIHTAREGILLSLSQLADKYQHRYVPDQVRAQHTPNDTPMDESIMVASFNSIDTRYHTGLKPGHTSGSFMALDRYQSGKCPISGRIHDSDNAYLVQRGTRVLYGCHRGCTLTIGDRDTKVIDITMYPMKGPERNGLDCLDDMANNPIE